MAVAALVWLLLGLILLLLELLGADFDGLLAGAVAALTVSALNGLWPWPPLLQVGAFVALAALLLTALSSWSRRRSRAIPAADSQGHATVIRDFDADAGRVLWQGQSWAALNLDPSRALRGGERVVVLGREGTRLQVLPTREDP